MPLTVLDIVLLAVMLISGLLAMVRGFMREILSIAAWVIAAGVTLYGYSRVLPYVKQYVASDIIATAMAVAGLFLATLLIVSLITVKVSDAVLDSRVGALDRTLGFVFGLARGLIIMVVAFLFFVWLVPERQPDWIRNARSHAVLQGTGNWLLGMLPDDPETAILRRLKRPRDGEEGGEPPPPGQRSHGGSLPRIAERNASGETSYRRTDRQWFEQLLESTRGVDR